MSTRATDPFHDARTVVDQHEDVLANASDALEETLQAGAFWGAIALPFVHTPLLLTGLETIGALGAYVVLLVLNVVALLVGHGYNRSDRDD